MPHVGTLDVDLGLDAEALGEGEYARLVETLMGLDWPWWPGHWFNWLCVPLTSAAGADNFPNEIGLAKDGVKEIFCGEIVRGESVGLFAEAKVGASSLWADLGFDGYVGLRRRVAFLRLCRERVSLKFRLHLAWMRPGILILLILIFMALPVMGWTPRTRKKFRFPIFGGAGTLPPVTTGKWIPAMRALIGILWAGTGKRLRRPALPPT